MKSTADWFGVISGHEWPSSVTKGFLTGLPKKKQQKFLGGNTGGSSSTSGAHLNKKERLKIKEAKERAKAGKEGKEDKDGMGEDKSGK